MIGVGDLDHRLFGAIPRRFFPQQTVLVIEQLEHCVSGCCLIFRVYGVAVQQSFKEADLGTL